MKLLFGKSPWEMLPAPLEPFLDRAAADAFDAVEVLPVLTDTPADSVIAACRARGLAIVAALATEGATPAEHLDFLDRWLERAAAFAPLHVNLHTGRDHFPFEDNLRLFERAAELAARLGVRVVHETHRGRALFSAPAAERFLRALPDLRINADFSHWMVVHESDLSDQQERLDLAITRAGYIHARVGQSQGPQVPHPLAPEWTAQRDRHLGLWRAILAARRRDGWESFVITPEFGPAPYMPTLPFTAQPVADAWTVNVQMRDWLRETLGAEGPAGEEV